MDGIGFGEAANDNGSGTALVMELARIFSSPDVKTDRSIRFVLWNNEETGLNGAAAYVDQRAKPAGQGDAGRLGPLSRTQMAGHDPARHDAVRPRHAAPRRHLEPRTSAPKPTSISNSRGTPNSPAPRASWPGRSRPPTRHYATDYPANIGSHMTNTDSHEFQDVVASISVRENERGAQSAAAGTRNGTSPPIFTRPMTTRISGWA